MHVVSLINTEIVRHGPSSYQNAPKRHLLGTINALGKGRLDDSAKIPALEKERAGSRKVRSIRYECASATLTGLPYEDKLAAPYRPPLM